NVSSIHDKLDGLFSKDRISFGGKHCILFGVKSNVLPVITSARLFPRTFFIPAIRRPQQREKYRLMESRNRYSQHLSR
ncbi:hypothetical protein TNCV_2865731, partial [Trichonephila clavipes]